MPESNHSGVKVVPFTEAAVAWLETRRPYISAKTAHEYELNIKTLSAYFGEMRLPEITADQVRAYQKMRLTQCGPFSINHECCVLTQMRKRIGMPFEDYQPLPLPKEKCGRALRDAEKKKLFKAAASDPNWLACCCFARISANTTAGPKEVMTLRLKDIDLALRVIRIQPEGAKNVHRIRTIPLNDEALEAVTLALARARLLGSVGPDHYVFPFRANKGKKHDPARHQTTFKTAWRKLTAAAGIGKLRMYDLRHTAITNLLQDPKVSDKTAEDIAGHIDPHTKKRYSHTRLEAMREALEALSAKKHPPTQARGTKPLEKQEDFHKTTQHLLAAITKLLTASSPNNTNPKEEETCA
jgi:integrase